MIFILNLHARFEYGVSIQLQCLLFVNINMHIKPKHTCVLCREAWKTLGNMSKDQAMMGYVQEIQLVGSCIDCRDEALSYWGINKNSLNQKQSNVLSQIIETLPVTDSMAELMDALDPFYEIAEEDDDDDAISKAVLLYTGTFVRSM